LTDVGPIFAPDGLTGQVQMKKSRPRPWTGGHRPAVRLKAISVKLGKVIRRYGEARMERDPGQWKGIGLDVPNRLQALLELIRAAQRRVHTLGFVTLTSFAMSI